MDILIIDWATPWTPGNSSDCLLTKKIKQISLKEVRFLGFAINKWSVWVEMTVRKDKWNC